MKDKTLYSRRQVIKGAVTLTCLSPFVSLLPWYSADKKRAYRIGACDWSMGKRNSVESLSLAQQIGLDGVQVDLGHVNNEKSLWHKNIQQEYQAAASRHGVQISSLALGQLNKFPYKSDPDTEAWVSDSIDVAKAMGTNIVLLAFFGKGDLKNDAAGKEEVIRRLKKVAPKAEEAGVILGIESLLSAEEHLEIIHAVGSKNIRVYYDVANSFRMGYDIYDELSRLGKEFICEIHVKELGFLLGKGKIDFVKVSHILDGIGYKGWLIIENGRPKGADILTSYISNNKYLRSVFNT